MLGKHTRTFLEKVFFSGKIIVLSETEVFTLPSAVLGIYICINTHTQFDQWSSIYGFVHERARTNIAVLGVVGDAQ